MSITKRRFLSVLITLVIISLNGCYYALSDNSNISKVQKSKAPNEIVVAYFQASSNLDSLEQYERAYPDIFVECLLKTISECSEKRQKSKQLNSRNSNLPNVIDSEKTEISLNVKRFSKKIASESIVFKREISEWIINNEARVRVEVEIDGVRKVQDFLLYKDESWKIFEIVRENEHLYFASPSRNFDMSL